MLTANQSTNAKLLVLIAIHVAVLILGLKTHKTGFYVSVLNLSAGLLLLIYWIKKQLSITQHFFDWNEILMIVFEILVVVASIYMFVSEKVSSWLTLMQYLFFGIHLLALVLFFLFMCFFKIKRLI